MNHLVIHQLALTPGVLRIGLLEVISRAFNSAAATGCEHIERFATQVVGLDKGVDDGWGCVPPNWESNPNHIVFGDIVAMAFYCRP